MRYRLFVGVVGVVSAALLAATAGFGSSAAAESLTLYSGQHPQTVALLVADFERRTGIKVKVRSSGEGELANQILQEGSNSPADVFFAENPPALTALEEHGLLSSVDASTLASVPRRYSSPKKNWTAVSARSSVMVYNTDQLSGPRLPSRLSDFESPKWKGKFGFAAEETDFHPLITAFAKLNGGKQAAARWLTALKANGKNYADNESLVAAVNRGAVAIGLIDHYYWYRLRDEVGRSNTHSKLAYFAPRDAGALVDVSGAAVLKSSDRQQLAQRFLAYLVSKPAQTIIATSHSYEYPLRPGVTNHQLERPLSLLHAAPITSSDLGDGSTPLKLLEQIGVL